MPKASELFQTSTLAFPRTCAVCGAGDAELVEYTQEHFPIPIPFFGGVFTRSSAALPYCKYHAEAFHHRFRVLRITQYAVMALGAACVYPGMFMLDNAKPGDDRLARVLVAIGVICFAVVLPASLVVRKWMYDAFFQYGANHVKITSRNPQFIEQMCEINVRMRPVDDPGDASDA